MSHEKLFSSLRQVNDAKLRIICFPYAGGNSSTYMPWINELPDFVDLVAVELPGRSFRFGEPAYTNMERLIDDMLGAFNRLTDMPYILMGHSMGSRVAFELMRRCKKLGVKTPEHFIASGSPAPHIKEKQKKLYQLPTEELIEELRKLNGTPEEILGSNELMALAIPYIRADFELSETYFYTDAEQFECPITVLHGGNDIEITQSDAKAWEKHFTYAAEVHIVPGDHFFIEKNRAIVLEKINAIINDVISARIY